MINAKQINLSFDLRKLPNDKAPRRRLVLTFSADATLAHICDMLPGIRFVPNWPSPGPAWIAPTWKMTDSEVLALLAGLFTEFRDTAIAAGYVWGVHPNVLELWQHLRAHQGAVVTSRRPITLAQPPEGVEAADGRSPLTFQVDGVKFWGDSGGRGLLAWDMGTGKTFGACLAAHCMAAGRVVVLCPEHMRFAWAAEIAAFFGQMRKSHTYGLQPMAARDWCNSRSDFLICGYASAHKLEEKVGTDFAFNLLICDEAHYIKAPSARRAKAAKSLSLRAQGLLLLTGTPILSKPIELYTLLNMVDPSAYADFMKYARRYCNATPTPFGWDFDGASHLDELHGKLKASIMHRVRKSVALKGLPAKSRTVVPVELSNRDEYKQAITNTLTMWRDLSGEEQFIIQAKTHIEALRRITLKGKMDAAIQWVKDFLESNDGKLVVFCVHKEGVKTLCEALNTNAPVSMPLHGDMPNYARDNNLEAWRTEEACRVLVATIGAAGSGLQMTEAADMFVLETAWTPGEMSQVEDRIHRIGQHSPVTIHYMLAADTIDEKIVKRLHEKQTVIDAAIDAGDGAIIDGGVVSAVPLDNLEVWREIAQDLDTAAMQRRVAVTMAFSGGPSDVLRRRHEAHIGPLMVGTLV